MPWNDNPKPGPWGAPPPHDSPTPRGPRLPGPPEEPRLGLYRSRFGDRFSAWYRGPSGKPRPAAVATLIAAAIGFWLLTGLYAVQPNEQAVVTTFGAYAGEAGPGVRYHLPWPIQRAEAVQVNTLQHTDIGGADAADENESLMLTGDGELAELSFSVMWRVTDARAYLFNLDNPEGAVRAAAEGAMREVVGRTALQPLMADGHDALRAQTAALIQETLDGYHAGIRVEEVQIHSAAAPRRTLEAFRELTNARQNAGPAVEAAKTEAARLEQDARAEKARTIKEAQANAASFEPVYQEYKAAPAVTRERLYIETMKALFSRANKVIVTGKDASVTLPPNPTKVTPVPGATQ